MISFLLLILSNLSVHDDTFVSYRFTFLKIGDNILTSDGDSSICLGSVFSLPLPIVSCESRLFFIV